MGFCRGSRGTGRRGVLPARVYLPCAREAVSTAARPDKRAGQGPRRRVFPAPEARPDTQAPRCQLLVTGTTLSDRGALIPRRDPVPEARSIRKQRDLGEPSGGTVSDLRELLTGSTPRSGRAVAQAPELRPRECARPPAALRPFHRASLLRHRLWPGHPSSCIAVPPRTLPASQTPSRSEPYLSKGSLSASVAGGGANLSPPSLGAMAPHSPASRPPPCSARQGLGEAGSAWGRWVPAMGGLPFHTPPCRHRGPPCVKPSSLCPGIRSRLAFRRTAAGAGGEPSFPLPLSSAPWGLSYDPGDARTHRRALRRRLVPETLTAQAPRAPAGSGTSP